MVERLLRTLVLPILVGLVLLPTSALAHGVTVIAHAHGDSIHGEADYQGNIPVKNAKVTAFDPAGQEIGQTTTDEQGRFTLKARFRCDHRLLIDTGDGHGTEYTVPAAQLPKNLPTRGDAPAADHDSGDQLEVLHHKIDALQEQLDRHEQKVRLRDVLGGIGYILGLAGAAFYFLGGRRKRS